MEQKLAEYRARKANEHRKQLTPGSTYTRRIGDFLLRRGQNTQPRSPSDGGSDDAVITNRTSSTTTHNGTTSRNVPTPPAAAPAEHLQFPLTREEKVYRAISVLLKVVLWLILWALFVEVGFGAVYFIVSSLVIIYRTMRSGSRDRSKLSAYSVFNPNFERLEGTFTAEQFEKELRYGAGSVR